jgi:hypothetical protein
MNEYDKMVALLVELDRRLGSPNAPAGSQDVANAVWYADWQTRCANALGVLPLDLRGRGVEAED